MDRENPAGNDGLKDSIMMLEQILEVMPQDLTSLRALYNAYLQCNNRAKAFHYLCMVCKVACSANDADCIRFVEKQLPQFEADYPEKTAVLMAEAARVAGALTAAVPSETASQVRPASEAEIGEELALAWKLYEENQLSQEEYSSVLHDLTEVSSREVAVPVSVLHVLNDRGFSQMNRILNYLSSRSGVPCISLKHFELTEEIAELLPGEISSRDGALPFALFGHDLLVAVLNPFNRALIDKVEKAGGRRCHTYLVTAEEYDTALTKLRALAA